MEKKTKKQKMNKSTRNILIAFIVNLSFSIIEFIGGFLTNSIMIFSDAIHDLGDATSLGVSFALEKKSEGKPDDRYTYGYSRYSIISALLMAVVLIVGSVVMVITAVKRLVAPEIEEVNAMGMLILSIVGIIFNFIAVLITSGGENLNQRTTFFHMLEDVLGWVVVLIGSILMLTIKNPYIYLIDPILTIVISIVIFIGAMKTLFKILDILLEKAPKDFPNDKFIEDIKALEPIEDAHHLHVWTLTGQGILATVHIKLDESLTLKDADLIREQVNEIAKNYKINHLTVQFETDASGCVDGRCEIENGESESHHHHHHH